METNPYQTPESNLGQDNQLKRSVWWKIYFFFITILSVIGMISLLVKPAAGIAEYTSLLTWTMATIGLFGFVFLKPIYKPQFWLITLIVYLAYDVIYYFITNIDLRMGLSDLEFYISTAIGVLLSLPTYYALYSFSKPDNRVWQQG